MKKRIALAAAALVFFGCGCSTFRKMFDENPQKKLQKRETRRDERRRSNDPLFDLLCKSDKNQPAYLEGSKLSPAEREIVDQSFGSPGSRRDRDVIRMREEMNDGAQQRHDWVFGTKNGNLL